MDSLDLDRRIEKATTVDTYDLPSSQVRHMVHATAWPPNTTFTKLRDNAKSIGNLFRGGGIVIRAYGMHAIFNIPICPL